MKKCLEEWSPYEYRRKGAVSQLETQSYETVNEFARILSTHVPFIGLDRRNKYDEEMSQWIGDCLADSDGQAHQILNV